MSKDGHSDPTAQSRKKDHIELALKSQTGADALDGKFYYEPLLSPHPEGSDNIGIRFLDKELSTPIWVSSMTGGTEMAYTINNNLARACGEYNMGMGLGSCRSLLYSQERLDDFDMRRHMPNQPLYANLGVAQIEALLIDKDLDRMHRLVDLLRADGLIIHVNPMQEWLQPEGDRYRMAPIDVISQCLDGCDYPIIVKEVGQGMGPKSLEALLQLPLAAIDYAAHGGTNFALLELLRADEAAQDTYGPLTMVGHSAEEMVDLTNALLRRLGDDVRCHQVIISGGVRSFLDGYYLTTKIHCPAIYGQASPFLRHARGTYEDLQAHVERQIAGLQLAKSYLTVKA